MPGELVRVGIDPSAPTSPTNGSAGNRVAADHPNLVPATFSGFRLIGCNTRVMAEHFAANVLRDNATVWGTKDYTFFADDGTARFARRRGLVFVPYAGTASQSPEGFFSHKEHWSSFSGTK